MKALLIAVLFAIAGAAYSAEFYEWTDEKGVKQFTQQPPPPNVRNVKERRLSTNVIETSAPTYSVQQAVKTFPVTLYVTDCGDPCTIARGHLNRRGVPYAEKNPQKPEELEAFRKLTGGGMEVPLLVVGALQPLKGYLASDWDAALDAAGYPSRAQPGVKAPVGGSR